MEELNDAMYESKLIYYAPTFDDRVRTFVQTQEEKCPPNIMMEA